MNPAALTQLDEPVRRYFAHAIGEAAPLGRPVRLVMNGRIKLGAWLPFTAEQLNDRDSFEWKARLGPLRVVDRYAAGRGSMDGRMFGRARVFRACGEDTSRSAAARTALEAVTFAPACVLPDRGVDWRAESDDLIVATWTIPPERPEVWVRINGAGAIRSVSALRWRGRDGYVSCGCEVHAERRFGDVVVPSSFTVGWWFGTPRYAPFFRAEVNSLAIAG